MYDLEEARPATDALWQALREAFQREGLADVPERLTRGSPVVSQWASPRLFLSQCCGYDLVFGFSSALELLAVPRYAAETGCSAYDYRSCIIIRDDLRAADLEDLRGTICAVNGFNSYSGTGALRALVAPLSRNGRFFGAVRVSGSHVRSAELVRAGEADVASIDCVTHTLLARHRPQALSGLRVLRQTEPVPAPPYVTSQALPSDTIRRMRAALIAELSRRPRPAYCDDLFIDGAETAALPAYSRLLAEDEKSLRLRYYEMYPTGTALLRPDEAADEPAAQATASG
ncbi:MAG TPA: PhnD/SsuA/transferrin family substrate-binding protein [Dongiaceae bacterium]